jgi:hypothetical protein
MTDGIKYPPQQGYAWREHWERRLYELVQQRGFLSVTAFVDSRPGESLLDLAKDLGGGDVAAVQIQWRLVAEAEASGNMEACARSLLARAIRKYLPEGWQSVWVDIPGRLGTPYSRKVHALVEMTVALPDRYREVARRICDAIGVAHIPYGWVPADADDPILLDIFARHWCEPS